MVTPGTSLDRNIHQTPSPVLSSVSRPHHYRYLAMTGCRDRIVRLLALCALTVGFLSDRSHAFTTSPRLAIRSQTSSHRTFGVASLKEHTTTLQAKKSGEERTRFHLLRKNKQQVPSRLVNRFRRAIAVMWTAALLWFGGALHVAPSYAVSTVASPESIVSRVIPKGASLDKIVDHYVKDHMFDDDIYDPVESAYREAYEDVTTGKYPRALNEVASSLLGSDVTKSEKASSENLVISILTNGSKGLKALGLSATAANVVVYATTLVGVPSSILLGILSYANMQKRMRIRQNKKRYGEDYSLDATIKVEEDVEAPDDDEFDDDDDDEEDDKDDDDDEDE